MKQVKLDQTEIFISAIGLGAMPMSLEGRPSEKESIAVIHKALDLGVTLIDTADSYCIDERDKHHNERLIAKALATYRGETSRIIVATKGGLMRPEGDWTVNGDPRHIRKTVRESYEALGGKRPIPLWQLHAPDPEFSIEETLGPVREAKQEGLIRFVGLSNVTVSEIERARKMIDVVSVQNQYNPWHRRPEKDGVLAYCEKEGLTFLPWSPLGGSERVKDLSKIKGLASLAKEKKISPQRLVLAWMIHRFPCLVPIPGASHLSSIEDSVAAVGVTLSDEEICRIEKAFP